MVQQSTRRVLSHLYSLAGSVASDDGSDAQLLGRFIAYRDEAAFSSLLRRHGGLVLHVCRRALGDAQDAEDAFQATFLTLARNAGTIRKQESVASWLYGVAYRLAVKARVKKARRRQKEAQAVNKRQTDASRDAAWKEIQQVLDEELHRLPAKYQAPLVLCYLEGKTHDQVARQLNWPLGTVRGRVARGRELLKSRLARRGLTLSAAALATILAANVAGAVPVRLAGATCKAALAWAATGTVPAGLMTTEAAALAETGVTAMTTAAQVKLGLVLILALGVATAGVGAVGRQAAAPAPAPAADKDAAPASTVRRDLSGERLPEGASARMGSARFWAGTSIITGNSLIFTPDSKHLAIIGNDGHVHVWDAITGKEVASVGKAGSPGFLRPSAYAGISFSPDGRLVALIGHGTIELSELKTNKVALRVSTDKPGTIAACAFSPDSKVVAAAGQDGLVYRWEIKGGKKLSSLEGHKGNVNAVAWSPENDSLVSGGDDQTVRLWDAASGKLKQTWTGHRDRVLAVAIAPDGKTIASRGIDHQLRLWEPGRDDAVRVTEVPPAFAGTGYERMNFVQFTPDGKSLIVGGYGGALAYDVATGDPGRRYGVPALDNLATAVSPDGTKVATAGYVRHVRVWDALTGKELTRPAGHQGPVFGLALSPDKKTLATGGRDRTVRLWDLATGRELRTLRGHSGSVNLLQFSADGKRLVSASSEQQNDRTVSLWDVETGKELRLFHGHDGGVEAMALSADGKEVRTCDRTGTVRWWDLTTGAEIKRHPLGPTYRAAFSPDGNVLVFMVGNQPPELRYWDATRPQAEPRSFEGPGLNGLLRIGFSQDGRTVTTTSFDKSAQLWDMPSHKALRVVRRVEPGPIGGSYLDGTPPAFSPDGKMVAMPGKTGTALIEVATGKDRRVFPAAQGAVTALTFTPDGTRLITAGEDGTTVVWEVKPTVEAAGERTAEQLEALWTDLGATDAPKAYHAVRSLSAFATQALPLLRKRVPPAADVEQKRIEALIADLGSDMFEVRKKAEETLAKLGTRAGPAMKNALADKPSLDVSQRLERLLKALESHPLSAEEVLQLRAVEVAEAAGTAEARALIRAWSKGAPGMTLTEDARAALERLTRNRR